MNDNKSNNNIKSLTIKYKVSLKEKTAPKAMHRFCIYGNNSDE